MRDCNVPATHTCLQMKMMNAPWAQHDLVNIVLLTAGVMFTSQRIIMDMYSMARADAAFWVYVGTLITMVGTAGVTYANGDLESAERVGFSVASIMIGYQTFNLYNDATEYPAKARERMLIQGAERRNQSLKRLRQRTLVMLFHYVATLSASWLMIENDVGPHAWMLYLYFGGVSELSTLPYLVITYIRDRNLAATYALLYKATAIAFAVAFLSVRVFGWLVVIGTHVNTITEQTTVVQVLFAALTTLQMYWGAQIYAMVRRELAL